MRRLLSILAVNCLVFLVLAGLLFLGLEVYLRTTDALQMDISLYSPFNYRLNPLYKGYFHGGYVTVNKLGLRGPETTRRKPHGVTRIAFFGDSYTFGDEIDLEDTFPYLVQKRLEADYGNGYEVLNFGVPGYDTLREYSYLKEDGLGFEPDIVAVVYVYNDTLYNIERKAGQVRKASLFRSIKDYLAARSYAFYYVRRGLRTLKAMNYFGSLRRLQEKARGEAAASPTKPENTQGPSGEKREKAQAAAYAASEKSPPASNPAPAKAAYMSDNNVLLHLDTNPGWKEVQRGIRLFQDLARKKCFKLFFVIYPFPHLGDPVKLEGFRLINERLKEAIGPETPTLDLLEIFVKKKVSWIDHPKRAANLAASEAIVSLLEDQGWLDKQASE